ncbi:MAG: hypothetical protein A2583_11040 [Bdellovibrionales bacterium RIFOXYD1_FULL_53_11]|nr:MAG: hypothetical protein A2583_11040 [Bdellovibrionales bacterium RIFOXYD1_FULL_53_11]
MIEGAGMVLSLTLLFVLSSGADGRVMHIKSLFASPLSEPRVGAQRTINLSRGTKVSVVTTQDPWVRIRFAAGTGWVLNAVLSDSPPGKTSSLLDSGADVSLNARKRVSGFTSAAAARGLREGADDFSGSKFRPDFESVRNMEGGYVNPDDGYAYILNGRTR